MMMKAALLVAGITLASSTQAQTTTTVLNLTNVDWHTTLPESVSFTAKSDSTNLSFSGFNGVGTTTLSNIVLSQNGGGNLLYGTYMYATAAAGSSATQSNGNLYFSGRSNYDTFTTNFASALGATYLLSFTVSTNGGAPVNLNGLRVTAADASPTAAVPEPAAWAMMILGMGAIGFAMRRQKVTTRVSYAA